MTDTKLKINICCVTDTGIERSNNEDVVRICPDLNLQVWNKNKTDGYVSLSSLGTLLVVADGMGGENAGDVAAAIAVKSIEEYFNTNDINKVINSNSSIESFLHNCIIKSNQRILDHAASHPESAGLGTTVVILWIIHNNAYIAWCGDSRCYCFNPENGLKQLTKDHSYVQELVDKGEISAAEALTHPDSNMITECLGDVDADCEPDIITYKIKNGDIFLLCSDGLCGYCTDEIIGKIMTKSYRDIKKCQDELLGLALNAGGHDNISIALCATLPQGKEIQSLGIKERLMDFISRL